MNWELEGKKNFLNSIQINKLIPRAIVDMDYLNSILIVAREDSSIDFYETKQFEKLYTKRFNNNYKIQKVHLTMNEGELVYLVTFINSEILLFDFNKHHPRFNIFTENDGNWDSLVINNYLYFCGKNGSIGKYEIAEDNSLEYCIISRNFNEQCLSISANSNFIFAVYSDNTVRKFDTDFKIIWSNNLINDESGSTNIWNIKAHKDYLLAGLSEGSVYLIETKFGTLCQKLKLSEADILTFCIVDRFIYVTGADSRIFQLSFENEKLSIFDRFRGQSHDINKLINIDNILISGGVNSDLCLYNLKKENKKRHIVDKLGNDYKFCYGKNKSLVKINNTLYLLKYEENQQYSIEVEYNFENKIFCFAICRKDEFIAFSTDEYTQIFSYKTTEKYDFSNILIKMDFYKNNLIGVNEQNELILINFLDNKVINLSCLYPTLSFDFMINIFEVNFSNNYLVLGSKINNKWKLVNLNENYKVIDLDHLLIKNNIILANFSYFYQFLFLILKDNQWIKYNWLKNKPVFIQVPSNIKALHSKVIGISFVPKEKDKIILYSNYYIIKVNLKIKSPKDAVINKNKNIEEVNNLNYSNFEVKYRKNPIIGLDYISSSNLNCIEYNWSRIKTNLPKAIISKKYLK